jgi:hypothetical protein
MNARLRPEISFQYFFKNKSMNSSADNIKKDHEIGVRYADIATDGQRQ